MSQCKAPPTTQCILCNSPHCRLRVLLAGSDELHDVAGHKRICGRVHLSHLPQSFQNFNILRGGMWDGGRRPECLDGSHSGI